MILYLACVAGAAAVYVLVRPVPVRRLHSAGLQALAAIVGFGAIGVLLLGADPGSGEAPNVMFLLLAAIALGSAVQVIASTRPIYSALFFVLVVIASAGLFLLLEAEFMAFALVIVYAGAILITYMFVLMLAQQSPDPEDESAQAEYDVLPREPLAGCIVGLVLLALLARVAVDGPASAAQPSIESARAASWLDLERMPVDLEARVRAAESDTAVFALGWEGDETGAIVVPGADDDGATASLRYTLADGTPRAIALGPEDRPTNVQSVGQGLILRFPVSLELAGVILLMAMFGAVILARRQIELTDDEKREAAGMRRLGYHDDPADAGGGQA